MARFHVDIRLDIEATGKAEAQEILEDLIMILTVPGVEDAEVIIPLEEIE